MSGTLTIPGTLRTRLGFLAALDMHEQATDIDRPAWEADPVRDHQAVRETARLAAVADMLMEGEDNLVLDVDDARLREWRKWTMELVEKAVDLLHDVRSSADIDACMQLLEGPKNLLAVIEQMTPQEVTA